MKAPFVAAQENVTVRIVTDVERQLNDVLARVKAKDRGEFLRFVLKAEAAKEFTDRLDADVNLQSAVEEAATIVSSSFEPLIQKLQQTTAQQAAAAAPIATAAARARY